MAISKIILNGVTQMDVTGKTVTSASMRNGVTALKNDGTDITGSIQDMTLPSASSSTSSGTAKATITPTSSAQYLNIPEGYNDTAQFYTIAAASGSASNLVTGTFKGTTTGAAMDVTLNYSGSGYPVVIGIYPSSGYESGTTVESTLQRYGIIQYSIVKRTLNAPTYDTSGKDNMALASCSYKSSSSTASTLAGSSTQNANTFRGAEASNTSSRVVTFKNKTTMSVYIASTSYGFMANIEYKYWVIYSS